MTSAATRRVRFTTGVLRWYKPLLLAMVAVATIAVLAVYVFPTRTWLAQRAELDRVTVELDELRAERAALAARVVELDTDQEIEAIARSQYGLVRPGEEAYAVLPSPPTPIELPELWPFGQIVTDAPLIAAG